jgi:uncharacterized protein
VKIAPCSISLILVVAFLPVNGHTDASVATPLSSGERDPVRSDPSPNLQPPASMEEIAIKSHGVRINGLIYLAPGPGVHPIAILLHGYPGNERNLDLAQAVRRAGYNALFFDYRGNFGSGGTFSHVHSLEDVAAILAWVRSPEIVAKYHLDPTRVALIGHSFGAWLALFGIAHESPSVCVAALAAWNIGWVASRFAKHPNERSDLLEYFRSTTDVDGGPVHANPDVLLNEIEENATAWNYVGQADALKSHALLLVAATRDTPDENPERHDELAAAIHKKGGSLVKVITYEDDHPFSSHRLALANTVIRWLQTDCASTQAPGVR